MHDFFLGKSKAIAIERHHHQPSSLQILDKLALHEFYSLISWHHLSLFTFRVSFGMCVWLNASQAQVFKSSCVDLLISRL